MENGRGIRVLTSILLAFALLFVVAGASGEALAGSYKAVGVTGGTILVAQADQDQGDQYNYNYNDEQGSQGDEDYQYNEEQGSQGQGDEDYQYDDEGQDQYDEGGSDTM